MLLLSHLLVSDGTDTTTNYGAEEIAFFSCNDATAYEFPSSELAHVHASDTFTGDDGRLYAIVCGGDDGAQVMDISDPTAPTTVARCRDPESLGLWVSAVGVCPSLGTCAGVSTFTIGGNVYAILTAPDDDGVQLVDISHPAAVVPLATMTDGSDGAQRLGEPYGVDTFGIGSSTYAIVAAYGDSGIQLIDVTNPGTPVAVGHAATGVAGCHLANPTSVQAFATNGGVFAAVAAWQSATTFITELITGSIND